MFSCSAALATYEKALTLSDKTETVQESERFYNHLIAKAKKREALGWKIALGFVVLLVATSSLAKLVPSLIGDSATPSAPTSPTATPTETWQDVSQSRTPAGDASRQLPQNVVGTVQPFQLGDEGSRGGTFRLKKSDGRVVSCGWSDREFQVVGGHPGDVEQLYGKRVEFKYRGTLNGDCHLVLASILSDSAITASQAAASKVTRRDSPPVRPSETPLSDRLHATADGRSTATNEISCQDQKIASVADGGATVATTDGGSYSVTGSDHGVMRYEASQWSTGDAVVVCRSGSSASISNPAHHTKVQADYTGATTSSELNCRNRTIASVADGGATVATTDGGSYSVTGSDHGVMRYEASQWSTGDAVVVCRSGSSASISNPAHYTKVQATVI